MRENEPIERDYETEARAEGWVPESEWEGDEDRKPKEFVDAKTFVERGEKISGHLKKKLEKIEAELSNVRSSADEFRSMAQKNLEKERKEKEKLLKSLEDERAKAVSDGDGQRFSELDSEISELRSETKADPSVEQHKILVDKFISENNWYTSNDKLAAFADGIAERIASSGYTGQAYFNELSRRVKETFPEEFENPSRKQQTVEGGGDREERDPKPKSWNALPKDAKAQCEKFMRDIPGFTKEDYLSNYEWDE